MIFNNLFLWNIFESLFSSSCSCLAARLRPGWSRSSSKTLLSSSFCWFCVKLYIFLHTGCIYRVVWRIWARANLFWMYEIEEFLWIWDVKKEFIMQFYCAQQRRQNENIIIDSQKIVAHLASLWILTKNAQHCARHRLAVDLLNASHHHALNWIMNFC